MQDFSSRLANSLDEEKKAARELLELLQKEQSFLIAADVGNLTRLTEEKARIATLLSGLAKQRYDVLAEAGYEASEAGMRGWTSGSGATTTVRDAWNELLALAHEGKECNRVNGLLISQHMLRNQNALNSLHAHVQGGNFYGPDGQSTAKIGGRSLGAG